VDLSTRVSKPISSPSRIHLSNLLVYSPLHLELNPERPWTPIYDQRFYTIADKSGYAGALAKKLSVCSYLF
jgi:hypothetical protein